jgi:hypothetical protein
MREDPESFRDTFFMALQLVFTSKPGEIGQSLGVFQKKNGISLRAGWNLLESAGIGFVPRQSKQYKTIDPPKAKRSFWLQLSGLLTAA